MNPIQIPNLNIDRVEELNRRILGRNSGYGNQDALLDVRAQATKYTFPLQAATPKCSQPVVQAIVHQDDHVADSKYPWNGYVSNINNESILRNQVFALQRSPQAEYVPSCNSDLYISSVRPAIRQQVTGDSDPELLFPSLFSNSNPVQGQGQGQGTPILFNNDTRQQLKDS